MLGSEEPMDVGFTPDSTIQVHEEGALRLICAHFRSHEDGIPEWLKNSSDMYARRNADPTDCVILLMFRGGNRQRPSAIGCLDFGGMTTEDIEKRFRNWADPDSARSGGGGSVEGGHGNGGKCYMTQLFTSHSYVHTVKSNRGNRYGFKGTSFTPGYFPSAEKGRGYAVPDPDAELSEALKTFDLSIEDLPEPAKVAWSHSRGFTLVAGFAAKQHESKRLPVRAFIKSLQGHQQALRAISQNKVFVFDNSRPMDEAFPLALAHIAPIPGADAPRIIEIPRTLVDPATGQNVETGTTRDSKLTLLTSEKRMTHDLRSRHTIAGWTTAGRATGLWEVRELSRQAYAYQIYGDLRLDALDDYKQNDRRRHSESPLIRALSSWLSKKIDEYAAEFSKLDRLQASEEERAELSRINQALDQWKNDFLEKEFGREGLGGAGGPGPNPPPPPLPRGTPARVDLWLSHDRAGQGIALKPAFRFFDAEGNKIRAVPFEWTSSDWAVATIDGEINVVSTHAPGETEIKIVCKDTEIESNPVRLEVVDIERIQLTPSQLEIQAGSRASISAAVLTRDGRELQGVYLIWTESNSDVASVSSSGSVFGLQPGRTSVTAGDDQVLAAEAVEVEVTEAEDKPAGGGGFPQILLSEIDPDPDSNVPPVFSPSEPPVHQRPVDVERNIWWINMASPLARRYLDTVRGGGCRSQEWRAYHIERYIEIIAKILLHHEFEDGEELTLDTMLRRWDEEASSMQARVIESLQGFLDDGALPEAA